ncbi:conserved protein of unknown function [Candidatus Promineifilum breve]|uniref:BrnT family toxin n=1 Tax=Candidatus Promineifilum breve TaxID=1806508 RepID=A0A160T6B4_9CHLR|nr:BrnT family toxin [Candidatus Promineifilum breve]CUS04788.2 conserved protein of unknown function [Candidatus Promineifilum breve]
MPDVNHILNEILFEWDSRKATTNLRKHGVRLELACEVFFDPFLYVVDEHEYVADELREKVIGLTRDWQLIFVVYVMREDRIRLVSAREATAAERMLYENQ